MRTKVTLVLIFLNVTLFFFIFHFERRWRTEESWKEARRRVLGAEASDIRTLEITGGSPARTIALEKRGDTWFLTQPVEWPANPNAVSRIINDLQFLEHVTSFSVAELAKNGQSLADYGLDHPSLTVAFTSGPGPEAGGAEAKPKPTVLRLGDETKVGNLLYLLSPDGQRIHVVKQNLARSLALTFDELRADTLFTIPVFEARSLGLQTAAPASLRIRLRRDGTRWTFETPIIARASKNATELAINGLDQLRVKSFIEKNPPAILPTANPSLRVSLEGNNRRETLIIGDPVPNPGEAAKAGATDYYAQLEGRSALFTVEIPNGPNSLMDTLRNAQDALRETRLLDFDARAVTALTLSAPNQPELRLQRLEGGPAVAGASDNPAWQIVRHGDAAGPQTLPADRAIVQRLLEALTQLAAKKFQSDAPQIADLENWGFNRPEREITLSFASGSPITLQIGLPTIRGSVAYARVPASSPSVYAIDPDILRVTPVAPRAWRERLVRELPAGAHITALKLTQIDNGQVLLDTPIDAGGNPKAGIQDPKPIQVVLAQLHTLRAKEFILDQFADKVLAAGEERPWKYRLDATVTLVGGTGEQTGTTALFLTERLGGDQQLAGSPAAEFNTVFAIEQPLLDALWSLTEGPHDPGPPPAPAEGK